MRWILMCLMVSGCTAVSAADQSTDVDVTVTILDAEYQAKQTATPDLPDQLENQQQVQPTSPARSHAVLITANFYCPPCEQWKQRLTELPFEMRVEVRSVSPTGSFPCLWYPNKSSGSGWSYYSGSLNAFLRNYDATDGILRSEEASSVSTKKKVMKQVYVCNGRRCHWEWREVEE